MLSLASIRPTFASKNATTAKQSYRSHSHEAAGLPTLRPHRLLRLSATRWPSPCLASYEWGTLLPPPLLPIAAGSTAGPPGDLGQLEIGLLLLLERRRQQIDHLLLTQGFGQRDIGPVSGDLIMLDPLHAGNNDQIQNWPLAVLLA